MKREKKKIWNRQRQNIRVCIGTLRWVHTVHCTEKWLGETMKRYGIHVCRYHRQRKLWMGCKKKMCFACVRACYCVCVCRAVFISLLFSSISVFIFLLFFFRSCQTTAQLFFSLFFFFQIVFSFHAPKCTRFVHRTNETSATTKSQHTFGHVSHASARVWSVDVHTMTRWRWWTAFISPANVLTLFISVVLFYATLAVLWSLLIFRLFLFVSYSYLQYTMHYYYDSHSSLV